MAATAGQVLTIVQEVEAISNTVMAGISVADPSLALPTATIAALEDLANKAIAAWSAAAGVQVTVTSAEALEPNPTPLTPPTS